MILPTKENCLRADTHTRSARKRPFLATRERP